MNQEKISHQEELFDRHVHRLGRITIFTCIILALGVPFVLVWLIFGIMPPMKNLISGIITVSSFMIPLSIAEILSFYPILGASGLYISYTTGNIANLKVPCAAIAMEAAEVKPGTKEGDIISTIAMAGSVIVSELILVLGVLLLVPLSGYLQNPVIKPAFDQILPALFGSLGAYFILKNFKLSLIPLVFGGLVVIFTLKVEVAVPICVLISVLGARLMYKKGWVKAD
ncbi:MAG: hypothetical protein GTO45_31450 [Candidatus Aminicenantes bacterium]|nr:hypothetical protein [Candidatus Aminicenantes bacterium]NIM83325.1 hypothetical protein [Candidatus Aminicenantes bacterium]NIN22684.1 hypothetical protein [Candidatus Aminicenantes bacterium]NIN46444.1 hypothetical protein [Candidatus Aminicenantes bacterium]NIN89296.1 hypothetical protein [Candidatus Aminicenantes bacterium]